MAGNAGKRFIRETRAVVLILAALVAAMTSVAFFELLTPPPADSTPKVVNISPGASTAAIASELKRQGLVKSASAFKLYVRFRGKEGQLRAGSYSICPGLSLGEIVGLLSRGSNRAVDITIPEGSTVRQVAALLEKKGLLRQEEFIEAVSRFDLGRFPQIRDFIDEGVSRPERLQGFLFPDTYKITPDMGGQDIVLLMLRRFHEIYQDMAASGPCRAGLSPREVVILASIVEREAKLDEERPLVAAVFLNRLRQGMPLQSCATVEYLLPSPKPVLSY